jgi:hypothetical protein
VTLRAALCGEAPTESLAETVKLYVVEGDRFVTLKVAPEGVPIAVPPW